MVLCDLTRDEILKIASDYFKVLPNRVRIELKRFSNLEIQAEPGSANAYLRINVIDESGNGDYVVDKVNELYLVKAAPLANNYVFKKLYSFNLEQYIFRYETTQVNEQTLSNLFFRGLEVKSSLSSWSDGFAPFYLLCYKITLIS